MSILLSGTHVLPDASLAMPHPPAQPIMKSLISLSALLCVLGVPGCGGQESPGEPADSEGLEGIASDPGTSGPRPNIVFFLVDDMGWMDSSVYGSTYYETPRMDRLAEQSMRFTSAYGEPLCSPTRASLLTGQYSSRHGVTGATGHEAPQPEGHVFFPTMAESTMRLLLPESRNYLEPAQYTVAEALRDAGYRTGVFGKWHLGIAPQHWPEQQGFEVAFHAEPSAGPPGKNYFSPYGVSPPGAGTPKGRAKANIGTITDGPPGEYITDRLTDEALAFIESSGDEPFFLNLWHYAVHGPWGHKEENAERFGGKADPRGEQSNPVMGSMLWSVDESLGRVLDKLDELGIADNTIVVFASDNGGNVTSMRKGDKVRGRDNLSDPVVASYRKWAGHTPPTNNAPLRDGKGSLYEGGIRVPLMVRWPGRITPDTTTDLIVGSIDFYPTILDLIGLRPSPDQVLDGVSYAPVLRGAGTLEREAYFTWFPHKTAGVAVRKGNWKLIRRFEERPDQYVGVHELFDLENDIGETENLATRLPRKVRELDALIDGFIADTGAMLPQPNPAYNPRLPGLQSRVPDPLKGLVPNQCRATVTGGLLRVEGEGDTPYLGTSTVNLTGPLTLRLRARCPTGGTGWVRWRLTDQQNFPEDGQTVAFELPAGDEWTSQTIDVPVEGRTAVVRLYLPADVAPVEIEFMKFSGKRGRPKVWNFSKQG